MSVSYLFIFLLSFILWGCGQEGGVNLGTTKFLEIDHVHEEHPGNHKATLIFLHGMNGFVDNQLSMIKEKGFFERLGPNVRIVAPQIKTTGLNPERHWFPYRMLPWETRTESVASKKQMDLTAQPLIEIIDAEAERFRGDYSRIFVLGYSQGGMVAEWIGLMSNRPLGGVVSYLGMFPVLETTAISQAGQNVPIAHFHDREDTVVRFHLAEAGARAASAAGAKKYGKIRETQVNGSTHHGLSKKVLLEASNWIADRMRELAIL